MNASERLQAVIKARLEGEAFGWGPILLVWAGVTSVRMATEAFVGPTLVGGTLAALLILGFQGWWPRRKGVSAASRGWALQGLWLLLAAATWFLGSAAPALGLLSQVAGGALELLFLAGGLAQTGIMKSRASLTWGGLTLALASVALALVPILLGSRALVVALALGLPAFLAMRHDSKFS